MFSDQVKALEDLLEQKPRGPNVRDQVSYTAGGEERLFTVIAIQQWYAKGVPHAVGLVWGSRCADCGVAWHQCTPTRVTALSECCPDCDAVGHKRPTRDERVCANVLAGAKIATGAKPRTVVKRRGKIELLVLETMKMFGDADTMPLAALVEHVAAALPPPEEGMRDTRPQHVKRALFNLSKEKDGPLKVDGPLVVLFE